MTGPSTAASASLTPRTSSGGIRLVKKLPGPMITASNLRMASATLGWMPASGSSHSRGICRPRGLPRVHCGLASRRANRRRTRRTARRAPRSPATRGRGTRAARADRPPPRGSCRCTAPSSRAAGCRRCGPPAWRDARCVGSRDSSTRRASPSLRASASAHLSTSPGGSTPSSSRSWPELPPLSNMVTTALRCSQGLFFKPPSRLGRPVPPPKHPTFSSRNCI